ncbi:MAG: VWA domain-containing protein [Phycisphaerales bacterium]|nr:VWA domain-containing protein [Phycisphaerales bacterium]
MKVADLLQRTLVSLIIGGFLSQFCVNSYARSQTVYRLDDTTPLIILYDQEGRPGKWVVAPAPKIEATRLFIDSLTPYITGRNDVSFRRFSIGNDSNKEQGCNAQVIDFPFGDRLDADSVTAFKAQIGASGTTSNHTAALRRAIADLKKIGGGRIILITDTTESCAGYDEAPWLAETLPSNIKIDVIAFFKKIERTGALSQIALGSGGDFYLVDSAKDFVPMSGTPPDGVIPDSSEGSGTPPSLGPDGDVPPLSEIDTDVETPNVQFGPLMAGKGGHSSRISVHTGIDQCPAFDQISKDMMSYAKNKDAADETERPMPMQDPVAIEFILDASGSMAGRQNGQTKMNIARKALNAALSKLDGKNAVTALRAYGFDRSVPKTPEMSCPNTELLVGFEADQSAMIARKIKELEPYGYTPIARSLQAAAEDLKKIPAQSRLAVLITDGEETCGGNPTDIAADIEQGKGGVVTIVVGYDLNEAQRLQMENVARAGKGSYLDASSGEELNRAIDDIVDFVASKTQREKPTCDNPVMGGKDYENATLIKPGIYTIGELLEKGEYRYYKVKSRSGERATVRNLLQSWRMIDGPDGPIEATVGTGAFTVEIQNPDGTRSASRRARVTGLPGSNAAAYYVDTKGNGFVIAVGDAYDRVAADSLFEITITPAHDGEWGDTPGDIEAENFKTFTIGQTVRGHFGYDDNVDIWKLTGSGSAEITFEPDLADIKYRLTVFDAVTRKRIARGTSPLTVDMSRPVLVRVENREPSLAPRFSRYHLTAKGQ